MKTLSTPNRTRALTWIEVLIILGVLIILPALLLPILARSHARASPMYCINNVRQITLGFRIWAGDHGDKFPMQISTNEGGTMEFVGNPQATYLHFLVMSNEIWNPKVLICTMDTNRIRSSEFYGAGTRGITVFSGNSNLSYFVGVDAVDTNENMFLVGDRNITNLAGIQGGLLLLTSNQPAGWTRELHDGQGNIGLADGGAMSYDTKLLQSALVNTGTATNRLAMP